MPWSILLQALAELGVSFGDRDRAHRVGDGLFCPDEDEALLCPGDAGVEEVSLQHHVMGHQDRHHHYGVFAALGFVDGGGIGQDQLVQLCRVVVHEAVVEAYRQRAVL